MYTTPVTMDTSSEKHWDFSGLTERQWGYQYKDCDQGADVAALTQ